MGVSGKVLGSDGVMVSTGAKVWMAACHNIASSEATRASALNFPFRRTSAARLHVLSLEVAVRTEAYQIPRQTRQMGLTRVFWL